MSLSIWMNLDAGGPEPICIGSNHNITHNVHAQIRAAMADPWEFHGRTVRSTLKELEECNENLHNPALEEELRKLDPENGWGDLDASREFIAHLLEDAKRAPNAVWEVSR